MNIFITGLPGCGKSTLIKEIISQLKGKKICGFLTPEIRTDHERKGFLITSLDGKQKEFMAHADKSVFGRNSELRKFGKYWINIGAIDKFCERILNDIENCSIIVIEEIGKMEFFSEKFKEMLSKIIASKITLTSKITLIATLHRAYVKDFKNKGKIFVLTRENFNVIKREILMLLFC